MLFRSPEIRQRLRADIHMDMAVSYTHLDVYKRQTLARLTSTPMTLWPMDAKQAADTEPTYPNPKMLMDKSKRILLAIEYLGLTHYTNPLRSASKPFPVNSRTPRQRTATCLFSIC